MKNSVRRFVCFILLVGCTLSASSKQWKAQWITSEVCQSKTNSWICFHNIIDLPAIDIQPVFADIAVDSKYWLWINGELVVFEGGLKRGPNLSDTYYDHVDISAYLKEGKNTIALLLWYFGKEGFSHNSSGKAGLLFDCQTSDFEILSNGMWKCEYYRAYEETGPPHPNFRLPESNVRFDARKEFEGWTSKDADPSFPSAVVVGPAGMAPWLNLVERPIPLWKNYGVKEYVEVKKCEGTEIDTFLCKLPYNSHITPILDVEAPEGCEIRMQMDNYLGGGEPNVRAEYVTKSGRQQYESLGWMNGHWISYLIPKNVKVHCLQYRETGYDTEFVGTFSCNDDFLNRLREKAVRTLYVTMRDTYMDCPDRERSQWWGDEVNELGEAFYVTDQNGHKLALKGIRELMAWQRTDGVIFAPCPAGNWRKELPLQMLASVGYYGFYTYYLYSGDSTFVPVIYDRLRRYMHEVWQTDADGLVVTRQGDWSWGDWGEHIDLDLMTNAWYYLALKGEYEFARMLNKQQDMVMIDEMMRRIVMHFNARFWNGKEYRSPNYTGETDDRGQALAVLAGLADAKYYPLIRDVLLREYHASPYMEKYVGEALFVMGYPECALKRTRIRFEKMVNHPDYTTLWEGWGIGNEGYGGGTVNHAWSGGTLTLLSQYVAGIAPLKPAFKEFQVAPMMGDLTNVDATVFTPYGLIKLSLQTKGGKIKMMLDVPEGTTACVADGDKTICLKSGVHRITIKSSSKRK